MPDFSNLYGIQCASPVLFALQGSESFGRNVAQNLGIALGAMEEREFEDGEHKSRPLINVRNRDVFVLHSLYGDARHSCNDKLCRLLFFIGALKDAGAARVTAVLPYLAYARKDQKSQPRDPTTTRYVAQMFEACGVDAVVTMDVHNRAAFQNAFRCRTELLEAKTLFVEYFRELLRHYELAVVSPDAGGIKRADSFRRAIEGALGKPVASAFAEKYRSQGVVSGEKLVGDVRGKLAIILDDLISSGTTIARTARACKEHGAEKVVAAATHGQFAGKANTVLADEAIDKIVVCDTIPAMQRLENAAVKAKLTVLGSATFFAEAIARMHTGGSLAELMQS